MKVLPALLLIITSLFGQNIQQQVLQIAKSPVLRPAQWSVYARYVDSDHVLVRYQAQKRVAPASGLKLFSTACALNALGANFRFQTQLAINGPIKDGVLNGDLLIIGGGDPTLGSARIKGSLPLDSLMQNWALAIRRAGIKKINGNLIAYSGHFSEQTVPGNWLWSDLGNYYAAGAGGININDNLYRLFFKPSRYEGGPAKILRSNPDVEGLTFQNNMRTGRRGSGDNGYIYCAPQQMNATVRGTIPAGVKEFDIKGSIPQPALFCLQQLRLYLHAEDIDFNGKLKTIAKPSPAPRPGQIIAVTFSPALDAIVQYINHRSFNLYAEAIGKESARAMGFAGSDKGAARAIKKFLVQQKVDVSLLDLYDACGLSPANVISAKLMVDLLTTMTRHKEFDTFYNSMSIAGVPDSIGFFSKWGLGTAMANNARIKSGLINHVRSHSGYVRDKKGRLIAFSFIANNYKGRVSAIDKIHQKLLLNLANGR